MSRRPRTLGAVLVTLACMLYVAACGGARTASPVASPPPAASTPPNLVDQDAIRRAGPGSPQRAILEWAQAVQFVDVRAVLDLYSPAAVQAAGPGRIERAVRTVRTLLGRPQFVETITSGPRRARVRAFLVSYDASHRPTLRQPITFDLVRGDGSWLLDDAAPLIDMSDQLRAATSNERPPAAPGAAATG